MSRRLAKLTMDTFLKESRSCLGKMADGERVHVVLGNESCDLDSTVCAVTYAYYLSKVQPTKAAYHIPVLNIPKEDYNLRKEVSYCLSQHDITADKLTFKDQIDLFGLSQKELVSLTLVDHNVISDRDKVLDTSVVEVIDHRKVERKESSSVDLHVEMVGSCATLIAEKMLSNGNFTLDSACAKMLYSAIIFDTGCFDPDLANATPKDREIAARLQGFLPGVDSKTLYGEILAAKSDVSDLTSYELLRKDLKFVHGREFVIAMSSLPIHLEEYLVRKDAVEACSKLCEVNGSNAVILMSLAMNSENKLQRQTGVYSQDTGTLEKISALLVECQEPALELTALPEQAPSPSATSAAAGSLLAYLQGNVTASRKKILPHVKRNV